MAYSIHSIILAIFINSDTINNTAQNWHLDVEKFWLTMANKTSELQIARHQKSESYIRKALISSI